MAEEYEVLLTFALPKGEYDAVEVSDAVFEAGFEDALVGTGVVGLLCVETNVVGDNAESAMLHTALALMQVLPVGTTLCKTH